MRLWAMRLKPLFVTINSLWIPPLIAVSETKKPDGNHRKTEGRNQEALLYCSIYVHPAVISWCFQQRTQISPFAVQNPFFFVILLYKRVIPTVLESNKTSDVKLFCFQISTFCALLRWFIHQKIINQLLKLLATKRIFFVFWVFFVGFLFVFILCVMCGAVWKINGFTQKISKFNKTFRFSFVYV